MTTNSDAPRTESLSELEIRRALLKDAVQHPATSVPLAVCLVSAIWLGLISFRFGYGTLSLVFLAVSALVAVGTFLWRYFGQFDVRYELKTVEVMALLDQRRSESEDGELKRMREALRSGFADIGADEGTKVLQPRQNNTRLGQAAERTLTVATNVVMVGLAIQTALARERQVMEASARTREFIGDLIVANADVIKQHTEDIGEAYNNPVIAIDKITQAHEQLFEAIDIADRLKQEGIVSARENIAKLNQLSSEIRERVGALPAAAEPKSLEA